MPISSMGRPSRTLSVVALVLTLAASQSHSRPDDGGRVKQVGGNPQISGAEKTKRSTVPVVTLSANPASLIAGGTVTLSWSSINAKTCAASGGWQGVRSLSGSESVTGVTAAQTFSLTCTGKKGAASQSVSVEILPPAPTVSLSANPSAAALGSSATLAWSATNATSCTASGGWTGSRAVSGSEASARVAHAQNYELVCTGAGGTGRAQVTVNPICSDGGAPPGGPAIRGVKLWMSNNPPTLFDDYLGKPFDSQHFESWHDVLVEARCSGANDVMFQLSTGVMTNPTDNIYSSKTLNPPDAALIGVAKDARAMGLSVSVAFFNHVENVITGSGGLDRAQPTDRQLWMQSFRIQALEAARLSAALNAHAMILLGDETQHLVRDPTLTDQWVKLIRDVRTVFPGTITTQWWTTGHGDSITEVPESIIRELDYIGIGFFPNLSRTEEPSLKTLCRGYHLDADGGDPMRFLRALSDRYGKRVWITDKAFHSFKGASYDEWRVFDTKFPLTPDEEIQARLYDSFLAVIYKEGSGWLEGVSFQNFNNLRDGVNPWIHRFVDGPVSESPQHKLAEGVMSDWFSGRRTTGC